MAKNKKKEKKNSGNQQLFPNVYFRVRTSDHQTHRILKLELDKSTDLLQQIYAAIVEGEHTRTLFPAPDSPRKVLDEYVSATGSHVSIAEDADGGLRRLELIRHENVALYPASYLTRPDVLSFVNDIAFEFKMNFGLIREIYVIGARCGDYTFYRIRVYQTNGDFDEFYRHVREPTLSGLSLVLEIENALRIWEGDPDCTYLLSRVVAVSSFFKSLFGFVEQ